MNELERFFERQNEPLRSCLMALKDIILNSDPNFTLHWKYGMPFFYYRGKMSCYLWFHKKYKLPYIGIADAVLIEDDNLLQEDRKRFKIFLIDPFKDIPKDQILSILNQINQLKYN